MLDTTDARGLTSTVVYRGSRAGEATVRVLASGTGESDSLTLLITAGNPASVEALPADTALRVGAGFRLRATVRDRAGNQRSDSPTFATVIGGTGLILVDHDSLAAQQIARVAVEAAFGDLIDTAWVSVVPDGVLAAFTVQSELAVFQTDGRGWHTIGESPFLYSYEPALAWHPSGGALVYIDVVDVPFLGSPTSQIFQVDLQGNVSEAVTLTESHPGNLAPLYSLDGAWLYYTGVNFPHNTGTALYRQSADGEVQQLTYWNSIYTTDTEASPSPDGSRIAFVTDRPDEAPTRAELAVLTVADDAILLLGLPARTPRWSPTGDVIAFLRTGQAWLVDSDGSNPRLLAADATPYRAGLSWSPDGQWLAAATDDGVRLIQAATGLVLPLAFTRGFASPAWRP